MSSSENDLRVSLEQAFDIDGLVSLRSAVAAHADRLGLPAARIPELVLVAHELASNSGPGLTSPRPTPHGFDRPSVEALGGRGLWLAHTLCDEFAVSSDESGTVATASMLVG
jgi:anti-sigma regulatory factor (Ser/Thr protein kinase)